MEADMGKRILIVDDEEDVRVFLTAVLRDAGYDTLTASDGVEALDLARREPPDLISLDLQMPNQTGTDFYRKLSRDKVLAGIPIIVVSGLAGRHLALRQPFAVFEKPIDPEEFLVTVKQALA